MSNRTNGFGGMFNLPPGDDNAAGTYEQYIRRHPQTTRVAKHEPEVQKPAPFWRRAIVPALIGLLVLLIVGMVVHALANAGPHSQTVTVCDADRAWTADRETYEFETSDGEDFAIVHPDGAQVEEGKVYVFEWTDTGPLTSFDEVEGATPASCE